MPSDEKAQQERAMNRMKSVPAGAKVRPPATNEPDPERVLLSREQVKIARWLKKLKFRKVLFGGIREQEVWKRMGELNALYEAALVAERARCDALIEQARAEARGDWGGEPFSERRR